MQFGRADPRYRRDGRVRRRAGRLMDAARRAWDETPAQMPFVCVELHEVHHAAPDLMRRVGLSSYDAVHAATAAYADIPIVTLDAGFSAVPASTLPMLTDAARVPWCRSNRARGSVTR